MRRLLAALVAATPFAAEAATATVEKDPLNYSLGQYGAMLSVALLGGLVSWIGKVRRGDVGAWNIMQLVGELATSAFAGLLCFWICEAFGTPSLVTISLVGISGHMGTRAIVIFERWAARKYGLQVPPVADKDAPL
jgi:hypothetical protein